MRTGIYADLFVVPKIEKTTGKVPALCTGRRIHAGGIPFTFRNPEAAEAAVENKKKERPAVSRAGLAFWCTGSLFSGSLGTASRFLRRTETALRRKGKMLPEAARRRRRILCRRILCPVRQKMLRGSAQYPGDGS